MIFVPGPVVGRVEPLPLPFRAAPGWVAGDVVGGGVASCAIAIEAAATDRVRAPKRRRARCHRACLVRMSLLTEVGLSCFYGGASCGPASANVGDDGGLVPGRRSVPAAVAVAVERHTP